MYEVVFILITFLDIVKYIIFGHVIISWLVVFGVLNVQQPVFAQIWFGLNRLLEPIYAPIRRILPNLSGIDLAPLVALFAILILQAFLPRLLLL